MVFVRFGLQNVRFGLRRKLLKNVSVLVFEENFFKNNVNFSVLIKKYYLTIIWIINPMFSDEFRERKMSFTLAPGLTVEEIVTELG